MEKISIYPKEELMNELKAEAKKQKRSLNNQILFILDAYFEWKQEMKNEKD